jgi:hypothetical protein
LLSWGRKNDVSHHDTVNADQEDQADAIHETGNGPTVDNEDELIKEAFPDES